jgi:hypothetical protein
MIDEKVNALLAKMTRGEKARLLQHIARDWARPFQAST